jgi:hypothetical protein
MTELIAKTIVKNQFWIVTDGEKKVGNIEANNAGYGVQINGTFLQFNNADEIKKNTQIKFETVKPAKKAQTHPYPEYPTTAKVYNSVMDVQRGLHLFTTTKKSKCFHAAGWFVIDQNGVKQAVLCPKYIFIQRYEYEGPFKTETEAKSKINT